MNTKTLLVVVPERLLPFISMVTNTKVTFWMEFAKVEVSTVMRVMATNMKEIGMKTPSMASVR